MYFIGFSSALWKDETRNSIEFNVIADETSAIAMLQELADRPGVLNLMAADKLRVLAAVRAALSLDLVLVIPEDDSLASCPPLVRAVEHSIGNSIRERELLQAIGEAERDDSVPSQTDRDKAPRRAAYFHLDKQNLVKRTKGALNPRETTLSEDDEDQEDFE